MLSLTRGRPIAKIFGGRLNGEVVHIYDPDEKCCEKCNNKCGIRNKYCCENCTVEGGCLSGNDMNPDIQYDDMFEVLDEDFIRKGKKKMTWNDIGTIKNAIKHKKEPMEPDMRGIYGSAVKELHNRSKKEFFVPDGGVMRVVPNPNKTERIYAAGPTDSGKSYWSRKYIDEWSKIFPDKPIFLFSDVDEDEELDDIKRLHRIKINDELITHPLKSTDFPSGSLVLFDDTDSIVDPKILKAVEALRNHLLRRGRHESLYVIVSNHMLSDYTKTRIILNECNGMTVFPKSGSSSGITYVLKKYCGLSQPQVYKIMNLNSRWVTVYKNYPMFVVYDKGAFLL
ncbi:MAG TPA: hypothetical protein VN703_06595 [Candidatus Sulfopaludibacter sp.]|nr:hypothetical protein [Candidatus Sulfopaludibacter sp.]